MQSLGGNAISGNESNGSAGMVVEVDRDVTGSSSEIGECWWKGYRRETGNVKVLSMKSLEKVWHGLGRNVR